MKSKKNVGIGMIGCGNIGAAFVDILAERSDELEAVAGVRPGLKRIAVASLSKSRPERVRAVLAAEASINFQPSFSVVAVNAWMAGDAMDCAEAATQTLPREHVQH